MIKSRKLVSGVVLLLPVFAPMAPEKASGQIYISTTDYIKRFESTTLSNLNDAIKPMRHEASDFKQNLFLGKKKQFVKGFLKQIANTFF